MNPAAAAFPRPLATFLLLTMVLGAIAAYAPAPSFRTDRDVYEAIGRQHVILDCSDLHCFRVLVAWMLDPFPGPSLLKWKSYAVLANAGAAVALGRLCITLGLSARTALLATWLAGLGSGPLLTLFNCYTSDPLMFLMGPLVLNALIVGRRGHAGLIAGIGVFAKEFAAAPLWIFCIWSAMRRRWEVALRSLATATGVTLVWVGLQLWLMLRYNYTYAGSASADIAGGGDLAVWLGEVGYRGAAMAVFGEFGALWVVMPIGLLFAPRDLRLLAVAAAPAALALVVVQQPDRALWNFHFIAIPLAVLVLRQLPDVLCGLFVLCYALANLRIGAQLTFVPAARVPLSLSLLLAAAAVVLMVSRRARLPGTSVVTQT